MIAEFVQRHDKVINRLLEILPGAFSWTLILFPLWGSFWVPHYVAYFIIIFDIYWFYKSAILAATAVLSHLKIRAAEKYDWLTDAKKLDSFDKIHHLVIIPTYLEPESTIAKGLHSLVNQDFPHNKISIILAIEKRESGGVAKAKKLQNEFGSVFAHFWITVHPDLPGEVKGKSSNQAWAGKFAKTELIDKMGLDIDFVTVTSKDADAVLHPKYFSYLTYKFLTNGNRYHYFWQAAIMFYSNIWRVPAPIRVVNTFNTIWQTAQASRQDRIINYSTYSLSLKMLDRVGYWDVDVIPEDYRLFFKSFFALEGKVEVEPIFLWVHADAAESSTYWATLVNQYEQMKRWAWGASDDAYIIKNWLTHPHIPLAKRTLRVAKVLEDHFLWPVNWFIITLGANIPILLNPRFKETVLGVMLPKISFTILSATLIFLLIILIVDFRQRPARPNASPLSRLIAPFEFILMPVVGLFFSALPGLDAHTRLMLGKYLEYRVTEKV